MPKQFTRLICDEFSTFQCTALRVNDHSVFNAPIVVGHAESRFIIAEQLAEVGCNGTIILEPCRRDSAAAVATSALYAARNCDETILLVMAADHLIRDIEGFRRAAIEAAELARTGAIMTLGIKPTSPATEFGYIRRGEPFSTNFKANLVDSFVEKPTLNRAEDLIADGALWNSGYFLFSPEKITAEFADLAPEVISNAREALNKSVIDLDFVRLDVGAYEKSPQISFDYALMEKTKDAGVLEVDFDWSDLGTWQAVWEVQPHDENGNASRGRVELFETSNSIIYSDTDGLTAVVGLDDVVVVVCTDVVMVASKASSGNVKSLVAKLQKKEVQEVNDHSRIYRPWGWYQRIDMGDRFQVKRIAVNPGGQLSLQKHFHRAEHWVVVKGTAEVTINERVLLVHENEAVYLPIGATHRLVNPGKIRLELIEVQVGSYTGEDDIVRIEDIYGRKNEDIRI